MQSSPTEVVIHDAGQLSEKMGATKNGDVKSQEMNGVPVPSEDGDPATPTLPPPAEEMAGTKQPLLLLAQLAWILLLLLPSMLLSLFRNIFPPKGKSLKDKVVLVTGAGRGLGRGLALRFAKEGAKVAVVDIFSKTAMETAREIQDAGGVAKAYSANVAVVEDIQRLRAAVTAELGPVDVLVNNAGLVHCNTILDMEERELKAVVEVNLLSHFWMTREFLPSMKERNSGHIVAISSVSAFVALGNASAYSACKSGVMGFMDALREELKLIPDNKVKTTAIYPCFVNTSAEYMNHVETRLPAISIEEAVKATVAAVRREEVDFSIPENWFTVLHLLKLLPQNIIDKFRGVMYARVILPNAEVRDNGPARHIIDKLAAK